MILSLELDSEEVNEVLFVGFHAEVLLSEEYFDGQWTILIRLRDEEWEGVIVDESSLPEFLLHLELCEEEDTL